MGFEWFIADTQTGAMQAPVVPASNSWSRLLNTPVTGQTSTFKYLDTSTQLDYVQLTQKWKRKLVTCWDGTPIYEGIITKRADDFNGTITVTHSDFRGAIMPKRTTFGEDGATRVNYTAEYHNYSFHNLIALLLRLTDEGPTPNFNVPLTFPFVDPLNPGTGPSAHDGAESRDYYDFQGTILGPAIDEMQNTLNGPDVDFMPTKDGSGNYTTDVRIGTVAAPQLGGNTWEFNISAPFPGIVLEGFVDDGSLMATDVTYLGKGQGLIRPLGTARVNTDGPALQRVVIDTTIEDDVTATQHAQADLVAYLSGTEQWSLSMFADGSPNAQTGELTGPTLSTLRLGDKLRLYQDKQRGLITPGFHGLRVIGFSGDMTNKVKLTVQPL